MASAMAARFGHSLKGSEITSAPASQGEVLGEVKGGMYFVDLQAAIMGSNDPLLAQMLELG